MKKIIFLSFIFLATVKITAQQGNLSPTNRQYAAYSLQVAPDAAGIGRAYSGAATVTDANATYWNLSALSFYKEKWGVSYSYMPWWKGHHYVAGFYNFKDPKTCLGFRKDRGVIAASIRYANLGDFSYDLIGESATLNTKEMSIDVGYSRSFTTKLAFAVALRYFRGDMKLKSSNLIGVIVPFHDANAFAGDISATYQDKFLKRKSYPLYFQAGARLSNVGTKFSYFEGNENKMPLPMNLRLGAAVTQELDEKNAFTFSLEGNKVFPLPRNKFAANDLYALSLSTAIDYNYKKRIYARMGYHFQSNNSHILSYGLGATYKIFGAQIAYNQRLKGNKPPAIAVLTLYAQFLQTKTPFQLRKKRNILM